jgi:hypothetical protein
MDPAQRPRLLDKATTVPHQYLPKILQQIEDAACAEIGDARILIIGAPGGRDACHGLRQIYTRAAYGLVRAVQ